MLYKLLKWKKERLAGEYFRTAIIRVIFPFRNFSNKKLVLLGVFCITATNPKHQELTVLEDRRFCPDKASPFLPAAARH